MLCDELIQLGVTDVSFNRASMKPIIDRIASAVKFELSTDFAQAADALATDFGQIAKALPFCRLPFRETWLELVATDRPSFVDGAKPTALQRTPKRVGLLLTATSADLDQWKAHLFWSIIDPKLGFTTHAGSVAMKFDMGLHFKVSPKASLVDDTSSVMWKKASQQTRDTLSSACTTDVTDYEPELWLTRDLSLMKGWINATLSDWAGEPAFLEAAIALMNSPNSTEKIYVDQTAFNVKRVKRDKPPLSSHHVLRIHPRQRVSMKAATLAERHNELRAHFVRGHWKVRGPGRIFFWRPFMRGKLNRGYVGKDYKVT